MINDDCKLRLFFGKSVVIWNLTIQEDLEVANLEVEASLKRRILMEWLPPLESISRLLYQK